MGWDRVILLFNEAIGDFPTDLPFDFIQNRANPYQYAESDSSSKCDDLSDFLEAAIKAVLDSNPKRPAELKGLSREKIEHDHDVENMRWLMQTLHLPTLQQHIENLPHMISDKALWFHENFHGVVSNSLFSVMIRCLGMQSINSTRAGLRRWPIITSIMRHRAARRTYSATQATCH